MTGGRRRIVGIDLGTTHTVVAWAEPGSGAVPQVFRIPQLTSPSELEPMDLLDSVLYAPVANEQAADLWQDAPWVVGRHARRRGALVSPGPRL